LFPGPRSPTRAGQASAGITGHIEFVLLWGRTGPKRMRTATGQANPFRDRSGYVILLPVGA
jgi:hypothetical protein